MAEAVAWRPEYSVGIAELDVQHQRLFRIAQELNLAISNGHSHEEMGSILMRIVRYTIEHFATEEDLMLRHDFPGAFAHSFEHNKFTLRISCLQKEHLQGNPHAAKNLLEVLQSWLREHVTGRDREYVRFFSARGVK